MRTSEERSISSSIVIHATTEDVDVVDVDLLTMMPQCWSSSVTKGSNLFLLLLFYQSPGLERRPASRGMAVVSCCCC